ncbi:hypothetical protein SKAU_G00313800 [Synaphobranchus kaupii]|uniref:Nucleoporin NUP42 n=1 Tax=Synaphobranchus kaupii TaxID=118154 RepID=A0A9Q1IKJ6_SYNKA|nr:hypothetical protein SKAU_G00313800 [Synaphobranchus kaupii]
MEAPWLEITPLSWLNSARSRVWQVLCHRGDWQSSGPKCRVRHRSKVHGEPRIAIKSGLELSPDMESGDDPLQPLQTEKENKSQTAASTRSSQAQHVCRFYSQGRFCQFGKRCRFLHQRGEAKQALKVLENQNDTAAEPDEHTDSHAEDCNAPEARADKSGSQPSGPRAAPAKREKPRRPCRYFLSGHCAMEDRCRFWHPEQLPSLEDRSRPSERGAPGPRASVARPNAVQMTAKLSELTAEVVKRLRDTEIRQLLKRIPKDRLIVQEREDGLLTYYRITVQPTDPDWPFDLKEIVIMVSFPETYPQEVFTMDVPEDQEFPAIMGRHLCQASQEWLQAKRATNELMGKVELLFRPFLHWLDRNMERLFTEGARQLKKDIDAERSGIRFVSYQQLQAAVCRDQSSGPEIHGDASDEEEEEVEGGEEEEEEEEEEGEEEEGEEGGEGVEVSCGVEGEESSLRVENVKSSEPRRGTEVRLQGLELGEETATVVARQIAITLQCSRCKVTADLTLTGRLPCTAQCEKCGSSISAGFRPSLLHHYSSVLGFLDLSGAVPVDLVLQDCEMLVGCLTCSQEGPLQLSYGQSREVNCQHCHTRLRVLVESTLFQRLQPRPRTQAGRGDEGRGSGRYPRDPAVQRGKPLPEKGTCKHYKQSQRWLRFSCCGRAYPCNVCHDEDQDHPMELATRMICGHCANEQAYSSGKPCISCGGMMTRSFRTNHWEGGQGCRNKGKMNRNDPQKYSSTNKTVSRKAASEKK